VVAAGAAAYSASSSSSSASSAQAAQAAALEETKTQLQQGRDQARSDLAPYSTAGRSALNALSYGMGLGSTYSAGDVPKDYKLNSSSDPLWNQLIAKYNPKGNNWTSTKMRAAYNQASQDYLTAKNQQYQDNGQTVSGGQTAGYLNTPYDATQYKNDPGYTPMVNSLADLQATPGYQFQLDQGLQSVNNSAAAKGSLLSGATLKGINDYAQGRASTGYQDAWNRAQQAYQNAFSRNQTNQNNTFNRLQTMANNGHTAATQQGYDSMQVGNAMAGATTAYGNNSASLALAQGQSNANMATGLSNAITSGVGAYNALNGGASINPSSGSNMNTNFAQQGSLNQWLGGNYDPVTGAF